MSQARRRQLRAYHQMLHLKPFHNTEARQHQGNLDVASDVVLSFSLRPCTSSSVIFFRFWGGTFCGYFAGIFLTNKTKAQTLRGNFGAFFVRNFVPRKKSFVQTSFCRTATPKFELLLLLPFRWCSITRCSRNDYRINSLWAQNLYL